MPVAAPPSDDPQLAEVAAVAVVGALVAGPLLILPAQATPPSGVTISIIGVGRFAKIDARAKTDIDPGRHTKFWKARIKTRRSSDLHVLQNTIAPGGSFGWHSHPGPSLVIVKSGTATFYLARDPKCRPHIVPAGFERRIDQPNPGNCRTEMRRRLIRPRARIEPRCLEAGGSFEA